MCDVKVECGNVVKTGVLDTPDEGRKKSAETLRWHHLRQISFGYIISLGQFVISFLVASTSFLPKLMMENSSQTYTVQDVKWIASAPTLAIILGCVACYPVIQRVGPATILRLYFAVNLGFFALMMVVQTPEVLLIARIALFFMLGLYDVVGVPLIMELSEPRVRGICGVLPDLQTSFGILFAYIAFSFLNGALAIMCTAIPICIGLLGTFFIPESPSWLVLQEEEKKAEQSLTRLLGPGRNDEVQNSLKQLIDTHKSKSTSRNRIQGQIQLLRLPENWKPLLLVITIFGFRELCGTNFILFYALQVFEHAQIPVDIFLCTITVGIVRLLSTLFSCILQYQFKRRVVMMGSLVVSALCLISAGIILLFDLENFKMLSLIAIFGFILMSGFGMGPMPFLFLGELVPKNVKFLGTGIVFSFFSLYQFAIILVSPSILQYFNVGTALIYFGGFNLLVLVILYFILPETKGKTFAELGTLFK